MLKTDIWKLKIVLLNFNIKNKVFFFGSIPFTLLILYKQNNYYGIECLLSITKFPICNIIFVIFITMLLQWPQLFSITKQMNFFYLVQVQTDVKFFCIFYILFCCNSSTASSISLSEIWSSWSGFDMILCPQR